MKTLARLGKAVDAACLGLAHSLLAEVSLAPDAEGETIGFRDARVDQVSDRKELNFVLLSFLSHQIPSSMRMNAADLLRKAPCKKPTPSTVSAKARFSRRFSASSVSPGSGVVDGPDLRRVSICQRHFSNVLRLTPSSSQSRPR